MEEVRHSFNKQGNFVRSVEGSFSFLRLGSITREQNQPLCALSELDQRFSVISSADTNKCLHTPRNFANNYLYQVLTRATRRNIPEDNILYLYQVPSIQLSS
jgi:hypothetical protein